MDMEYISLHRYIRHTPPDTEDLAKHQLRVSGSPDYGKRIYRTTQSQLDKGRRGRKRRVSRNGSARGGVRELKQGSDPHIRATVWDRGEAFEAIVE